MSTTPRIIASMAISVIGMLTLTACVASPGSRAPSSGPPAQASETALANAHPAPPDGEVIGSGTVMDVNGTIELCLGPVADSYPPQCSGIPLSGWSWEDVDGAESSGEVRWGAYAVTGRYDGELLTVSGPPMLLALYDPMVAPEDPTSGRDGDTPESRLLEIQRRLPDLLGDDGTRYLGSHPERGYLWVDVIWDDGTIQKGADSDFGSDVVVVRSALRSVDG